MYAFALRNIWVLLSPSSGGGLNAFFRQLSGQTGAERCEQCTDILGIDSVALYKIEKASILFLSRIAQFTKSLTDEGSHVSLRDTNVVP